MRNYRVLIVDDEQPLAKVLQHSFEARGFDVAVANDGISCLNSIGHFNPDVVIMDIMMPHIDGIETVKMIRGNSDYDGTLIVALSARTDQDATDGMRNAGADLYLSKPFTVVGLLDRVDQLVEERFCINQE